MGIARRKKGLDSQRFQHRCECGALVAGTRQRAGQRVVCPACKSDRWIFPRNPRSRPKPPSGRANLIESTADADATRPSAQTETTPVAARRIRVLDGRIANRIRRLVGWRPQRRWFSTPRLAAAAISILVAATVWTGFRTVQEARFQEQLAAELTTGRDALVRGDFAGAVGHLRIADRAARGVGGESSSARTAIQLYREADIWRRLAPRSLHELTRPTEPGGQPLTSAAIAERFRQDYAGRTVVIQTWISRSTADEQAAGAVDGQTEMEAAEYRFDWSLVDEQNSIAILADSDASLPPLEYGQSRQVLCGFELSELRTMPGKPGAWAIVARPGSWTLLTCGEPLERFGWASDPELEALLTSQAEALGIEP